MLENQVKAPRRRWLILCIVFISLTFGCFWNYMKIVPVLPELMRLWGINLECASLLVAIYGIGLIIFSVPNSILSMRFGFRKVGLGALMLLLVGTILDTFAVDYTTLLSGRLLESLGFGLFVSLSLSMVALWFPLNELGLAMGVVGNAPSFGTFLSLTIVGNLAAWGNWKLAWVLGMLFAFLSFMLWTSVRDPPVLRSTSSIYDILTNNEKPLNMFAAFKNRTHWLVCIALLLGFFFPNSTFMSLAPSYFNTVLDIDIGTASFYVSLATLASIPSGIIGGIISDKIKSRRKPYTLGFLVSAIVFAIFGITSGSPDWLIPILSISLGVCGGFIVPATQASAKELLGSMAAMGISMQLSIMGLGTFLAPIISAGYIVPIGWNAAFYAIALWCVFGAIVGSLATSLR